MIAQQRQELAMFSRCTSTPLGAFRCVGAKFIPRARRRPPARPGSSAAAAAGTVKNADLHLFRGRPAAARSPAGWAFRPRSNRSARSGVKGRQYPARILQIRNRTSAPAPDSPAPPAPRGCACRSPGSAPGPASARSPDSRPSASGGAHRRKVFLRTCTRPSPALPAIAAAETRLVASARAAI